MNWIDLAILGYVAAYTIFSFRRGLVRLSLELVGMVGSLTVALIFYGEVAEILTGLRPGLSHNFAKALAFLLLLIAAEAVIFGLLRLAIRFIPAAFVVSPLGRWGGLVPALGKGVVLAAIVLTVAASFPVPADIKSDLFGSRLGGPLVRQTSALAERIFGGAVSDTLNFLTIKPESGERVDLGFRTTNVRVDEAAEIAMLELVNQERTSRGIPALGRDTGKLREVARAHSRDMFARGYFAHETPEGLSPFDRMRAAGIEFLAAGENLALAPDVQIAHRGLMNSPGHRRNILDPDFRRVGIGAINGGIHGTMFTQNFTN